MSDLAHWCTDRAPPLFLFWILKHREHNAFIRNTKYNDNKIV